MKSNPSLPTLFYSIKNRKNWKLCYKLNDGTWETLDYISIHKCSVMLVYCAKLGIEARSRIRGCNRDLILLNLFSNMLTDRKAANE